MSTASVLGWGPEPGTSTGYHPLEVQTRSGSSNQLGMGVVPIFKWLLNAPEIVISRKCEVLGKKLSFYGCIWRERPEEEEGGGRNIKCPLRITKNYNSVPLFLTAQTLFILVCVILSHAENTFWVTWFWFAYQIVWYIWVWKNPRRRVVDIISELFLFPISFIFHLFGKCVEAFVLACLSQVW